MKTEFPFPVERLALERTVRLVTTARGRPAVLGNIVSDNFVDDLTEIEGATSGRLTALQFGADDIDPREFVVGVPHANFINAAFCYPRPGELNRFSGPSRGTWYAALDVKTCVKEVAFHMTRELERIDDFHACVDYSEMFASFAGEFVDLRNTNPRPECLQPDIAVGYPAGNELAQKTRSSGYNDIIYPSVRDRTGTCLAALHPQTVQSVAQGDIVRLRWTGGPTPEIEFME